jgi:hypothetical protein
MDFLNDINLQDCPICQGAGYLEEEQGWCFYVSCLDCGCHSVEVAYKNPEDREAAARRAADIWNLGKVIPESNGL